MDLFVNQPSEIGGHKDSTPWAETFKQVYDSWNDISDYYTSEDFKRMRRHTRYWSARHFRFYRRSRWALRADPNAKPFGDERDWRSPRIVREEHFASRGLGKRGRAALSKAQADRLAWETPLVDWQSPYDMFLSLRHLDRSIVRSSSSSLPSLSSAASSPATVSDEWVGEVVEQVTYGDAKHVSMVLEAVNSC